MKKSPILRLAMPTPLRRLFDYLPPQDIDSKCLIPGVRIRVPFQSRVLTGILIEVTNESDLPYEKLKRPITVLDERPLFTAEIFKLCQWAAQYYHYPLGEVFSAALPSLLRKGHVISDESVANWSITNACDKPPELNEEQQQIVHQIIFKKNEFNVCLIDGVTGSGKTEIYLRVIEDVLSQGKQALVLIPEISLTPQTIARFSARFKVPVVALHSNLTEKKRLNAYLAARSGEVQIVIGTRSAIFTSFANLGLIIVDEEHDASFKQQERFRYHARDLAVVRAQMNNIPVILGSATPSLESLYNAKYLNRYHYLQLPIRAGNAQLPTFEIIDLRTQKISQGLTQPLLKEMQKHLDNNNQVLLFLNKRGFAPVLYCTQCAYIIGCVNCDVRMVYHTHPKRLQCHHCDMKTNIPERCPKCHQHQLEPVGLGTQRLEATLQKLFPEIPIIRVDRDSTRRKGEMQSLLQQIHKQPKAILLGTQMLAKGHHFPNITLVCVIDADSGFFSVDFRAVEQIGQLLVQVAGRAGREDKPGTVIIQTRHPQNPALQLLLTQGYCQFAQLLLSERMQTHLPPYTYFATVRAEAKNEKRLNTFLTTIKKIFTELKDKQTEVLGPVPALIAKRKGVYCQQLMLKSHNRQMLQTILKKAVIRIEDLPRKLHVKWILDVDPIEV